MSVNLNKSPPIAYTAQQIWDRQIPTKEPNKSEIGNYTMVKNEATVKSEIATDS